MSNDKPNAIERVRTIATLPIHNSSEVITIDEYLWADFIRAGGPGIAGEGLTQALIGEDGCTYVVIDRGSRSYFDNAAEAFTRAFSNGGWNLSAVPTFVNDGTLTRLIYRTDKGGRILREVAS